MDGAVCLLPVCSFDGTRDLSSVECYDPVRNAWSLLPSLGSRRSCLGVGALRGLLYVAGGYDGASCLSSVEQFDPLVGAWTSVAAMEYRRRYCRLAVLGGSSSSPFCWRCRPARAFQH